MQQLFILFLLATSTSPLLSQNIDYQSKITQFHGSNCGSDPGFLSIEEHSWHGYLSDNINTVETYSGCIQNDNNGAITQTGNYAVRNQNNVSATQIRTRINAYEDDRGSRCSYDIGFNSDDCHVNQTCAYNFTTPLEYQWTSTNQTCGSADYNMNTFYQYRYATTDLPTALENSSFGFTTGGNRVFWGAQGAWADVGNHCAASGTITNNQTSSFSTSVNCVDQITFKWNVSSEPSYDYLSFYINGIEQNRISGTPGWATVTYNLDPSINHTLEWRYTKDSSLSSGLDRGFVDQIMYRNYTIPVVGTSFGANQWNVSCYNGRDIALSSVTYRGYYVENNLNINSQNHWATGSTPSNAASYSGCSVNTDNHTFVHKRQGFPCGIYNLNITGHDDEIIIYVNGTQVWNYNGCCVNHGTVWTGYLTSSSTLEIRVGKGSGSSNLDMNLVNITSAINSGTIAGTQTICTGENPSNLNSMTPASGGTIAYTGINYQWQFSSNNTTWSTISSATALTYNPPAGLAQTGYYRRCITDACGTTGHSSTATVMVNTSSTVPTIATITGKQCPNTTINLIAGGGTAGTGSSINWYTGPNGTGANLGSGNSVHVAPSTTTTYYARRQGICNTSTDDAEIVEVKEHVYAPVGTTVSVGYCTDNLAWNHFYNANDEIIFSLQGDLTGASTTPTITISNHGTYYQTSLGAVGSCTNGWSPGEEFFELPRSWNVDFSGTLNPPYKLRYYFPPSEKTTLETAAANHITTNTACNYTYKYSNPNGFYWFKNVGATYAAPLFDQATKLLAISGSAGGVHYSEMTGITSFSGGAGGIALSTDIHLPVELAHFKGWNDKGANVLQWVIETEKNNEYFEIERSLNPQDGFVSIGLVSGAANSSTMLTYLFEDKAPMLGLNYYRLRQVDFDGNFSYSKIIAIDVKSSKGTPVFFPNPTLDIVNYQLNTTQKESLHIMVIDLLGKTLAETIYQTNLGINSTKISLSVYPAGTYLIKVQDSAGAVIATERIIKQRP